MKKSARRMMVLTLAATLCQLSSASLVAAELEGVLDWTRKVALGTTITGVVNDVFVKPGDRVKAGDVLAVLDDRILKSRVEMTKARFEAQVLLHQEAEKELERNIELYERTVLSEHELETARTRFASAVASLKSSEADKIRAEVELERSKISAPFDGIIISRRVEVGQTVISEQQADVLIELAEAGKMMINVLAPVKSVNKLKHGLTVPVKIGSSKYVGKIAGIGFEPVSNSDIRYNVAVVIVINSKLLRAGQKATVKLP